MKEKKGKNARGKKGPKIDGLFGVEASPISSQQETPSYNNKLTVGSSSACFTTQPI